MKWPKSVVIKEVGPRDGLQNEEKFISTEDKVKWINQLSDSGLKHIEITSFVNPTWIPSLADALEVAKKIKRVPGVTYSALVPNRKGLESALEAEVDEIAVFMSASETHNKRNINKTLNETIPIIADVVKEAKSEGKPVRGYLSTVFGCPYEGEVNVDNVTNISKELFEIGIDELSLGDTIGIANPRQVQSVLNNLLLNIPVEKFAMHFHDTRGTAMANVVASLDMGITTFDSSIGGLGGCPYAPGASGNLATDELVYMLDQMEIYTGIERNKLVSAGLFIEGKLQRRLPSSSLHVESVSNLYFESK